MAILQEIRGIIRLESCITFGMTHTFGMWHMTKRVKSFEILGGLALPQHPKVNGRELIFRMEVIRRLNAMQILGAGRDWPTPREGSVAAIQREEVSPRASAVGKASVVAPSILGAKFDFVELDQWGHYSRFHKSSEFFLHDGADTDVDAESIGAADDLEQVAGGVGAGVLGEVHEVNGRATLFVELGDFFLELGGGVFEFERDRALWLASATSSTQATPARRRATLI
jgi:hypothetical protein